MQSTLVQSEALQHVRGNKARRLRRRTKQLLELPVELPAIGHNEAPYTGSSKVRRPTLKPLAHSVPCTHIDPNQSPAPVGRTILQLHLAHCSAGAEERRPSDPRPRLGGRPERSPPRACALPRARGPLNYRAQRGVQRATQVKGLGPITCHLRFDEAADGRRASENAKISRRLPDHRASWRRLLQACDPKKSIDKCGLQQQKSQRARFEVYFTS